MKQKENKSLFLAQFGDTPQLRVLDFLIDNQFFDFPMTEIARGSNISYNSLKIFFQSLVNSEIIYKTRRIGKSDYFRLNIKNPFVSNLIKLDWILTKHNALKGSENAIAIAN
jgi:predicted transcriptional regulator